MRPLIARAPPPPKRPRVIVDRFSYGGAKTEKIHYTPSGFEGIDAMFGGGIPSPAVILVGGGQGGGKSTIVLQIAAHVGAHNVLYVSAEEPKGAIRRRGDRLKISDRLERMAVLCRMQDKANDLSVVRPILARNRHSLVIGDSLNALVDDELDTKDEQENLRRNIQFLYDEAHTTKRTYLVVVRLNAKDNVYGVRDVEYIIDASARIFRTPPPSPTSMRTFACPTKNRFGPTDTEVKFMLTGTGLHEVSDAVQGEAEERAARKRRGKDAD